MALVLTHVPLLAELVIETERAPFLTSLILTAAREK
jgi:hypothetical protein